MSDSTNLNYRRPTSSTGLRRRRWNTEPKLTAVNEITRELSARGLRVVVVRRGHRAFAGGLAVVLDAASAGWDLVLADVSRALDQGVPLSVHIRSSCYAGTRTTLSVLAEKLADARYPATPLTISVEGATYGQRFNAQDLVSLTPARCRFVFIDQGMGAAFTTLRLGTEGWLPALHAGVRSRCPLVSAEPTTCLLPIGGLAVPSHSAWLPIDLDLARFILADGAVDEPSLFAALDQAVILGDALFDELSWCGSLQADDARLNRRLAVCIHGLAELFVAEGEDSCSFACHERLARLTDAVHTRLWDCSASLAASKGALPLLLEKQPSARWRDESHRQDWARRWQQAVARVQVRHRNLLSLSPFSLLSEQACSDPVREDLLALLAHADVVGFAPPPSRRPGAWTSAPGYHASLRRQVERFNATSFVSVNV